MKQLQFCCSPNLAVLNLRLWTHLLEWGKVSASQMWQVSMRQNKRSWSLWTTSRGQNSTGILEQRFVLISTSLFQLDSTKNRYTGRSRCCTNMFELHYIWVEIIYYLQLCVLSLHKLEALLGHIPNKFTLLGCILPLYWFLLLGSQRSFAVRPSRLWKDSLG